MKVFICSSANNDIKDKYLKDCEDALNYILSNNDLVFGACDTGLMGMSYKIAKQHNRRIIGITPEVYSESFEILECNEEITTKKIMDSTKQMLDVCDAVVVLPGGLGTVYEFFTSIQTIICKEKNVPIILYNSCGYYDKLIEFIDTIFEEKFALDNAREFFHIANNVEDLKKYL